MEKFEMQVVERFHLKIFKGTIVGVLSVALVAAILLLGAGSLGLIAFKRSTDPARTASKPSVDSSLFVGRLLGGQNPSAQVVHVNRQAEMGASVQALPAVDPNVAVVWSYVDAYQKASDLPISINEAKFEKAFSAIITSRDEAFGENYAAGQREFMRVVLTDPRTIQFSKSQTVVTDLVSGALNWFVSDWRRQLRAGQVFEVSEQARVAEFYLKEEARTEAQKTLAKAALLGALWAFGIFLSVALLLIFSKIENNLRDIRDVLDRKH